MIKVPIVLADGAAIPHVARDGDAGVDLASLGRHVIPALSRVLVPTGVSIAMPSGVCGLVMPRSGLALNHGITVLNSPGLIDSGYRGDISVILYNSDPNNDFEVNDGDRVAQLVFMSHLTPAFEVRKVLDATVRGSGGFGHSGLQR